jgi:hypothetical protein
MALGTPWLPRSRQEEGRRSERQKAKERSKRLHPGSGSGGIKGDASDEHTVEEYKLVGGATFRLDGRQLGDSHRQAAAQGKEAIWVITFDSLGIEAEVRVRRT